MRHFFLRDKTEFPVACIATEKVADEKIYYAISICNPKDFHCFDPNRARDIAEQRLVKFINGGYDGKKNPDPTKPDFGGAKVGMMPFAKGENVKMTLLAYLEGDPDLPKHFRSAIAERIGILKRQAEKRQAALDKSQPAGLDPAPA